MRPARTLRQRALALLARRDYSRAELAVRLARTGGSRDEVEPLLDELERAGYLCDARFASGVVRSKAGSYSKRAIAHALKEKGVAAGASREALEQLESFDDLSTATALWQRRFGCAPADEREKSRQVRFLLARGYTASIAFRVLRNAGTVVDAEDG